jgi:periplasmic protein CpxP/Spy
MTIKRTFLAAGCLAALLTTGLVAQHGPGHHGFSGMRHRGAHIEMMAERLGLDDAQKATVRQLHQEAEAKAELLIEQRRELKKQNHQALEAGNANATEIGNRTIAAWELGQQIRAIHEETMGKLAAVLTAEQKAKLEKMKERHREMRGEMDEEDD